MMAFFFCSFDSAKASFLIQQASEIVNSAPDRALVQRVERLVSLSSQKSRKRK